jgi:hypothetical protein
MRTRTPAIPAVGLLLLVGCAAPPKAPSDLNDLSLFLFREWPDSQAEPMESGITTMQSFLSPLAAKGELSGDINARSWQVNPPQKTDLTGITFPAGANPQECVGAAVAFKSAWSIQDHAKLQLQTNQLPAEPTATLYTRTFTSPTDPSCFLDQSCVVLNTSNDVTRANPLGTVNLTLMKDFRWVSVKTSSGTLLAFVARSWTEKAAKGSAAGSAILQSYAVDVWIGISPTETWRYQANYSQSTPTLDTSILVSIQATGVDENLQGDDAAIKKLFHS